MRTIDKLKDKDRPMWVLVSRLINVAGFKGISIAGWSANSLLDMVLEGISFIATKLSLPDWRLTMPLCEKIN